MRRKREETSGEYGSKGKYQEVRKERDVVKKKPKVSTVELHSEKTKCKVVGSKRQLTEK